MLTKTEVVQIRAGLAGETAGFHLAFEALGDAGRFRIFKLLLNYRDICVSDIAKIFAVTVSAASQQLRTLERLGLVKRIKKGQMVCYEINKENRITRQLVNLFFRQRRFASEQQ